MTQSIVRVLSPEERELGRYLAQIEERKTRLAEFRAELDTIALNLSRFEVEYHARVGVLFLELDKLRLETADYEYRISLLQAGSTEEDAQQAAEERFSQNYEDLNEEDESTRQFQNAYREQAKRLQTGQSTAAELKRLYRELAKRHHPDLARTEEERRQRSLVMQRVNAAFSADDLDELRRIEREEEITDPTFDSWTNGAKLVWAIREVARLDDLIGSLERAISNQRSRDLYNLWHRQQSGQRVIESLIDSLNSDLSLERERLSAVKARYQEVVTCSRTGSSNPY